MMTLIRILAQEAFVMIIRLCLHLRMSKWRRRFLRGIHTKFLYAALGLYTCPAS